MKKIILLCLVSAAVSAQVRTSQDKDFDLIHSELHVKPIWSNQTLEGKAILTLKPYFYNQNKLVLNAKDFDIKSIKLDKSELKYTYDGRLISISLGKTFTAKDSFKLAIDYIAQPEKIRVIDKEENRSEKGLYFINPLGEVKGMPTQFWTQGETQSSSSWFPTIDFPNQNHTQDIFITIDKKYTTLSNGLLKSSKDAGAGLRIDHWNQSLPHAVYLTMIAAGDFVKVVDKDFKPFEISYYMEPEYAPYAHGIFGRTGEMINYFESLLGVKYPWAKYAQVPIRKFVSGAMENTTATTHNRSVLKNNHQLIDENDDAVIAHELFHHWFGDYVTCESWSQLPLNEAFANYSEYLWANHKYGKDEGDYTYIMDLQSYIGESQEKKVPLIRFDYLSSEDMFDAHSYQKGGRILHTLRDEVGDEAFFKALNVYLNENAFQTVEVEDLRIVFEKVTGKDLKWFFDQWFMREGHPVLDIKREVTGQKLKLTVNQVLDSASTHLFRVKLPMRIITDKSVKDTVLQILDSTASFEFELDGQLTNYIPNAGGYLLGVVKDDRSVDEYIHQFEHSPEIFSRIIGMEVALAMSGLEAPLQDEKYRDLVLKAMNDKFWRIRQMAVQLFMDYDGDNFFDVEKALEGRIKNDESSNVRADALLSVKTFQNPYHTELALKSMTDTSYAVRAAALEILLVNQVPQADSLVTIYQDVNDSNIFAAVANYFVAKNEPGKTEWMINRMKLMEGMDLYQFLGLLGSYLIVSDDDQLEKALPFLRETAINESAWYSRLSGVRVLYSIKDLSDEANAVFQEAIKAETDERLINYYKQFDVER
jgi:aminopeptidase N